MRMHIQMFFTKTDPLNHHDLSCSVIEKGHSQRSKVIATFKHILGSFQVHVTNLVLLKNSSKCSSLLKLPRVKQ